MLGGGLDRGTDVSVGGQPGHRQDDDRPPVPDDRVRRLASAVSTSRFPRPRTSFGPARPRTAGRSKASRSSSSIPPENLLDDDQQQSLLYSSDLELGETTKRIFEAFERVKPDRVVLDSLSEIRLLAQSSLRYRRQILALKHYFARSNATVLMLDDLTTEVNDKTVHSRRPRRRAARGARARIWRRAPASARVKYRGRRFRGGFHDFTIETGGVRVFPRLVSAEHQDRLRARSRSRPDSPELNALLGGGIERGSSVLVLGPAGTGKSLLAAHLHQDRDRAGRAGGHVRLRRGTGPSHRARPRASASTLQAMVDADQLVLEQVDAAELTPGRILRARAALRRGAWRPDRA